MRPHVVVCVSPTRTIAYRMATPHHNTVRVHTHTHTQVKAKAASAWCFGLYCGSPMLCQLRACIRVRVRGMRPIRKHCSRAHELRPLRAHEHVTAMCTRGVVLSVYTQRQLYSMYTAQTLFIEEDGVRPNPQANVKLCRGTSETV